MVIETPSANDQTIAGCDAIAQAVIQTSQVVRHFENEAKALQQQAKNTLNKAGNYFRNKVGTNPSEQAISAAVETEIDMLQNMASTLEMAQTTAQDSMTAAMNAVQAATSAVSGDQASEMVNLETATLQAIQGMTN